MDNSNLIKEDNEIETRDLIKVYKKRWFILFIFSINSLANACLFTSVTSINEIICRYYGITPEFTDWAANSFNVIFCFIALPSAYCMDNFGVRTLVLIGSSLNAICVCLHLAGTYHNGIAFLMAGQFTAGFSVGAILQVPARLSTVWFPEHEHAKATSIAMVFNTLGLGIGYLQPSYMVPDSDSTEEIYHGLYAMNITHLVFIGFCLIMVYMFFDEKPPSPPSYATAITESKQPNHVEVPHFKESLRLLFSNWNFIKLAIGYGIYFGLFNYFVTCLNEMASHIISSKKIGWLGFSANLVSVFAILFLSSIVDRFRVYRLISVTILFGTILSWSGFTVALIYWKTEVSLYASFLILNFVGVPFFVVGIEYVSEITYPISEGISTAIILMLGNVVGLAAVLCFGQLVDNGNSALVCYIIIGLYTVSFGFICFVKPDLKRSDKEMERQEQNTRSVNNDIKT